MAKSSLLQICSISDCSNPAYVRGWCSTHYLRWYKHGDSLAVVHIRGNHVARFWSKVNKTPTCWLWVGWRDKNGYGRIMIEKKGIWVHRYSFFLAHGRWPEPCGRHTCDVRSCVNPAHIIEGTQLDNVQDRHERGRDAMQKGEQHPQSRLTDMIVLEIRRRLKTGETGVSLAKRFGTTPSHVSAIHNRKVWKHI